MSEVIKEGIFKVRGAGVNYGNVVLYFEELVDSEGYELGVYFDAGNLAALLQKGSVEGRVVRKIKRLWFEPSIANNVGREGRHSFDEENHDVFAEQAGR